MRARRIGAALMVFGLSGFASCRVEDDVDARVWSCETDADCGTQGGKPMSCWQRYCMPGCDPSAASQPSGSVCVLPGALLETCSLDRGASLCPGDLNCYRTDLASPEGLCVPTPVCSKDEDCAPGDARRNVCASTLVASLVYPSLGAGAASLFGNLQCVQSPCESDGSACAADETCLNKQYVLPLRFPELCVPKCDGRRVCPPNFACAELNSAEGAARVCVPGLPGVRCGRAEDCIVGTCLDTGAGFSVCSESCDTDADCARLSQDVPFWCVDGPAQRLCVAASPYHGPNCDPLLGGADCPPDAEKCTDASPYADQDHGECRRPCDAEGRCPVIGGLPHVCLSSIDGGCYPGEFGLPCLESEECVRPLSCFPVELDGREPHAEPMICTIECSSDSDCDGRTPAVRGGYCGADKHCRLRALPGELCERNEQCRRQQCAGGRCFEEPE